MSPARDRHGHGAGRDGSTLPSRRWPALRHPVDLAEPRSCGPDPWAACAACVALARPTRPPRNTSRSRPLVIRGARRHIRPVRAASGTPATVAACSMAATAPPPRPVPLGPR